MEWLTFGFPRLPQRPLITFPHRSFPMHHPELPVVSFLCFFLVLSVLPSHIRAGSVATIALIAWLSTMSLIRGINSLVWADNFDIKIPVWCDITTKISIGFTFAVPAAALCVLKHLESIASARIVRITPADKRKRQIFEGIMCFGIPALFMALHYIIQGHRFDLYEDLGCQPTIYYSLAGIFLYYGPPLLMSSISFVFTVLSLYHFLRLRINFSLHLRNNNSSLSPNRYFRLMAMAIVVNMWDTGINTYTLIFTDQLSGGLRPWISWANVHSNWSFIAAYPTELFPPALFAQVMFVWWIIPISCFIFFIFFGFGSEVQADYRAAALWVWTKVFRQRITSSPVLPFTQSNANPVAIRTSTSFQSYCKPSDDSTYSIPTRQVRFAPSLHSLSRSPSVNTVSSPSHSEACELTPTAHPYAVLPDHLSTETFTDRAHNPSSKRDELPEASSEIDRFRTYIFPRPGNHFSTNNSEKRTSGGELHSQEPHETSFASDSRQSFYSTTSQPEPHSDDDAMNSSTSHDFEVVSKTLSVEFVPRGP